MEVCLVEPSIPPNTGNVARLCAALDLPLHLIEPLGFEITDKALKRAGLDYWPLVRLYRHMSLDACLLPFSKQDLFFFSVHARQSLWDARFAQDSLLVFGNEIVGLPQSLRDRYPDRFYRIPMLSKGVRSLNLSSAVAVAVYEAQRQRRTGSQP